MGSFGKQLKCMGSNASKNVCARMETAIRESKNVCARGLSR